MSIMSAKYKAHKFVNIIFYLIVFIFGFLVGIGAKKININTLFFKFLMIDNVNAQTMTIDYDNQYFTQIESNYDLSAKYSYLKSNFLDNSSYIYSYITYYYNGKIIVLFNTFDTSNGSTTRSHISWTDTYLRFNYVINANSDIRIFDLDLSSSLNVFKSQVDTLSNYTSSDTSYLNYYSSSASGYYTVIGTQGSPIYSLGSYSKMSNIYIYNTTMPFVIDKSSNMNLWAYYYPRGSRYETDKVIVNGITYTYDISNFPTYWDVKGSSIIELSFDEDLFADDNNFKEVCVNNHSSFAITRTSNPQNLDYMTDYDYIWFPYNIHSDDISMVNYENSDLVDLSSLNGNIYSSSNIYEFEDLAFNFYNSQEKIDSVFDSDDEGLNLKYKGYTEKYSYYGWSSLLFNVWFDYRDNNNFNFFPIITFNIEHSTVSLSSNSVPHGGGGRTLGIDEELDNEIESSSTYCFYIKNDYSITQINTDEYNDFYGTIPTQDGDFNFSTSKNQNNIDSSGIFSIITNFISRMNSTIMFINNNIFNFYSSMPLIVRMFVLFFLTLLVIKILLGMVIK